MTRRCQRGARAGEIVSHHINTANSFSPCCFLTQREQVQHSQPPRQLHFVAAVFPSNTELFILESDSSLIAGLNDDSILILIPFLKI